ncbi:hypothetical protein [uncultured Brevundimonas sp.]|uniref:hypothetical protein n=1 Tax=uncultured Brevundimonas sp. TaxID=213418 RepID=UPI0030EE0351|tara:strand:- start:21295 stop:22521 length:1227 start_codon:yes stop_codon:yes gene_type:complete
MKPLTPSTLLALALTVAPVTAFAQSTPPGPAAASTTAGDVLFDSRLRYEGVNQDGLDDATAVTLRARLGWQSPDWSGFRLLVEGEGVVALVDDYNDTIHGPARYPVVADPEGVELNRLQLTWTGLPETEVVLGRQRIILGNARFVGNVGFRQNEQTFDAVKVTTRALKPVTVTYVWIDRVHRIFGDDSPVGEWNSDSHLINVDIPTPMGRLTTYGYLLDFANAPAQSSSTWGARLEGSHALSPDWSALYAVDYARQSEYGANPANFDLDYGLISAGLKHGPLTGTLAVERLDGNGTQAFQTPLATLHAFQGWADIFLNTPRDGLRDVSATVSYAIAHPPVGRSATLAASWRDIRDADGANRYGRELDLTGRLVLDPRRAIEIKAARFDGAQVAFADRTKVWVAMDYRF